MEQQPNIPSIYEGVAAVLTADYNLLSAHKASGELAVSGTEAIRRFVTDNGGFKAAVELCTEFHVLTGRHQVAAEAASYVSCGKSLKGYDDATELAKANYVVAAAKLPLSDLRDVFGEEPKFFGPILTALMVRAGLRKEAKAKVDPTCETRLAAGLKGLAAAAHLVQPLLVARATGDNVEVEVSDDLRTMIASAENYLRQVKAAFGLNVPATPELVIPATPGSDIQMETVSI